MSSHYLWITFYLFESQHKVIPRDVYKQTLFVDIVIPLISWLKLSTFQQPLLFIFIFFFKI